MDGQTLNHLCHRPFCVQPAHLYAGDHASNARERQIRKQTQLAHPDERLVLPGGWDELTERNERVWQSAVLYREPDHPEAVPLPGLGVHKHHFTIPVGAIQNQLMYACEVCGASSDDGWRTLEEYLDNRRHCEICHAKLNRPEVEALMEQRKTEAQEGLSRQPQRNQEYHEGKFDRLMNVRDLLHFSLRPGRRPLPSAPRLAIVRSCFSLAEAKRRLDSGQSSGGRAVQQRRPFPLALPRGAGYVRAGGLCQWTGNHKRARAGSGLEPSQPAVPPAGLLNGRTDQAAPAASILRTSARDRNTHAVSSMRSP